MADRKRRGGARWLLVRQQAFNRDRRTGAVCWICGKPIDYSLPISSAPKAWEADHYLPFDLHPEYEYDLPNIRPSHMSCNRARGTRAGIDLLGTPSRQWRRPQG